MTVNSNYKVLDGIITLMKRWKRVEEPRKEAGDGASSEQVARYWPPHTYEKCLSLSVSSICLHLCVIFRITFRSLIVQRYEYISRLKSTSREYFSQVEKLDWENNFQLSVSNSCENNEGGEFQIIFASLRFRWKLQAKDN